MKSIVLSRQRDFNGWRPLRRLTLLYVVSATSAELIIQILLLTEVNLITKLRRYERAIMVQRPRLTNTETSESIRLKNVSSLDHKLKL